MDNEINYYTYLDECSRNYLTELMKPKYFEEYSITSVTFEKKYYQSRLESEWNDFSKKYSHDGDRALHFVDFKKLISSKTRKTENPYYSLFLDEHGSFSLEKLKMFFSDLKKLLESANFNVVHVDYYWDKQKYFPKRKSFQAEKNLSKLGRRFANNMLNDVPYLAMRNHLDLLMQSLLKCKSDGTYYFDEMLPKMINTKLRFDADGKNFEARPDLKKAYNHTISVGSDMVSASTATDILDEIRFIRKEEVGHCHNPNHCGLEIVDFLCSMISGEMRKRLYLKENEILPSESYAEDNYFMKLQFEDGHTIDFSFVLDRMNNYKGTKLDF